MRRLEPFSARRAALAFGLSACGASGLLGGCGSDDGKSPVEVFASQYGDATCGVWEGCCRDNGLSFDRDKCGLYAAIYVQGVVDKRIQGGSTFDAAAADKCIAEAVKATKACQPNDETPARAACAMVWSGPKKIGEKCHGDDECEKSKDGWGVCIGGTADVEGVCGIRTAAAKLGDACGKPPNGVAPEAVADCDGNGFQCNLLSQTCSDLVPIGGNCGTFNRCAKGAFCDDTGMCVAALEAGATCSENAPDQCKSGACVHGKCGVNGVGTLTPCTGEMM